MDKDIPEFHFTTGMMEFIMSFSSKTTISCPSYKMCITEK